MESTDDEPDNEDDTNETPHTGRSPVPWLVAGFLGLLALFLVVNGIVTDDADVPVGDPPPDTPFELLGGGTTRFSAYRGTPLVVNFFASWCVPCIHELPDLQAASETFADQITVIGLSVSDRVEDTERLLVQTGVTFPVGLDPNGAIHREVADLAVMPSTAFIAADGTLLSVHAGALSADELDERIRTELLADTSVGAP